MAWCVMESAGRAKMAARGVDVLDVESARGGGVG